MNPPHLVHLHTLCHCVIQLFHTYSLYLLWSPSSLTLQRSLQTRSSLYRQSRSNRNSVSQTSLTTFSHTTSLLYRITVWLTLGNFYGRIISEALTGNPSLHMWVCYFHRNKHVLIALIASHNYLCQWKANAILIRWSLYHGLNHKLTKKYISVHPTDINHPHCMTRTGDCSLLLQLKQF